jgi:hypothetical protein
MDTRRERRVAFGLGSYEPILHVVEADGLMDIYWGEVPYDDEAEYKLVNAIQTSGIHTWLRSLFYEHEHDLPETSVLSGPGYGSWIACPADLGEQVVDIMSTFIRLAMRNIIPTLEWGDGGLSNRI